MLTIDEIRNVAFRRATRGYKPDEVNQFIDEIIITVEQQKKENADLINKIDILAKRIEQYREDEETVRNALIASQKISDTTIREANEKAESIINNAKKEATALITEGNNLSNKQKENYMHLKEDAVKLRDELLTIYKSHLQIVDELPTEVALDNTEKELEKKYPAAGNGYEKKTKQVTEEISSNSKPVVEERINTVPQEQKETTREKVVTNENNNVNIKEEAQETDPVTRAPKKGKKKFSNLKFGENYDVGK